MSNFPKFGGFNISVTNEEVEADKKSRETRLTPGEHELEILDVDYKGSVQADPTWVRYQLILGKPGTQKNDKGKFPGAIYHSVMVPTQDIRYNDKLDVFSMLQSLFDGLGEALTPSSVPELIPAYFSDHTKLIGMKLKCKLGYKADHVEFRGGKFYIADKTGKLLPTSNGVNEFATKEAALGQAFTDNISVTTSKGGKTYDNKIELLYVFPGPKQREDKPKGKSKAKASADW